MYTCYMPSFKILASLCSLAVWVESYLVDTFSRDVAHMIKSEYCIG